MSTRNLMRTFQSNDEQLVYDFIKDTGMPLNKAASAIEVKPEDFLAWWSNQTSSNKTIGRKGIERLSSYLKINEDSISRKSYSKTLIRKRLFENPLELPEEYSIKSYSFLRSSAHIIKYITLSRGQHFTDQLLQKLNLSPLIYEDTQNKINIKYFIDLLQALKNSGFQQKELDFIASLLFLGVNGTSIHSDFLKAKSYQDCFTAFAQNINNLESNFEYKLDIDSKNFMLVTTLYFENHHGLEESISFDTLLRYRTICLSWFPRLSNFLPIFPEKTEIKKTADYIQETHIINFDQLAAKSPTLSLVHL